MTTGTLALTVAATLLWILKREYKHTAFNLRIPTEDLEMTGNAIGFSKFNAPLKLHTLMTATFFHATRSHLVNNFLMLWGICEFEQTVGSLPFVLLFLSCGAIGWLSTLAWLSLTNVDAWQQGTAQFQSSIGASPATYGVCAAAAAAMQDTPIGTALGLRPAIWLSLLIFLPKFLGNRFQVNLLVHPSAMTLHAILCAVNVVSFTYFVGDLLFPPGMTTAGQWFFYYLAGNLLLSHVQQWMAAKRVMDQTDHASHLGGAMLGALYGFWVASFDKDRAVTDWREHSYLAVSLLYLTYCTVNTRMKMFWR